MGIFTTSLLHVHDAVNGQRNRTFSAVESEVPVLAAAVTAIDPKSTSPVHMKGRVRKVLGEYTVLYNCLKNAKINNLERFSFFQ